jgi:hypothetical protein
LTGGVPDLEFNSFTFARNGFDLEINADSGNVIFTENVVGEPNEKTGLTGPGVTNQKDLWSEKEMKLNRRSLELERKQTNPCPTWTWEIALLPFGVIRSRNCGRLTIAVNLDRRRVNGYVWCARHPFLNR